MPETAVAAQSVEERGLAEPADRRSRQIPALDGLRGLAILLIVFHNAPFFPVGPRGVLWLGAIIANVGWIGVEMFFVLSGFLITRQLLDSQASSNYYRAFFGRRILRIFPLYYAALLIGHVLLPLVVPAASVGEASRLDQFWLWVFLFNWAQPFGVPGLAFAHFWSLAVEEQFYLIWPFVVRKRDPRRLMRLCGWIALTALAVRSVMLAAGGDPQMVYVFTVCRMDALVLGAIVAALLRIPSLSARVIAFAPWLLPAATLLALVGALLTRAYTRDGALTQTIGYSILVVVFAAILLASIVDRGVLNRWLQQILSLPLLRSFGKYSYGMYVVHYPIILAIKPMLPRFEATFGHFYIVPLILLITLLSYAGAFVSYHALEKHFLRMKRWFVPTNVSGPDFETLQRA